MGELIAVCFISTHFFSQKGEPEPDKEAQARLCMAAVAGGMVGKIGDPALLLHVDSLILLALIPLALFWLKLAAVQSSDWPQLQQNSDLPMIIAGLVFCGSLLFSEQVSWILLGGGACLLPFALKRGARRLSGPLLWTAGMTLLSLIAILGGGPELTSWWLESIQVNYAAVMGPVFCAAGTVLALLMDGTAVSLVGAAMMQNALDLKDSSLSASLGLGMALGGLTPLLLVGVFRYLWKRIVLGVLVGMVYLQLILLLI